MANSKKPTTKRVTKASQASKIKTITYKEEKEMLLTKPFVCVTCGKRYSVQKGNFAFSQSPLYEGNNHFLPTCNSCLESLVEQYTEILGNVDDAIKRICLHFDMYVSEKQLQSSKQTELGQSKIKDYIRQCNLRQNKGKTYDTYLSERPNNVVTTMEDIERIKSDSGDKNATKLSNAAVDRWGMDYSPVEYKMLDSHYKMLKDKAGDDDVKDALIKDLCEQYVMKYRARKDKDIDRYEKLSKLYQQTLANADLKPKDTSKNAVTNDPDEVWGVFNSIVENYSPAEFIKEKGLSIFKDINAQDEYYRRFIVRPTNNLINGTNEMDPEYEIKDGDGDDE